MPKKFKPILTDDANKEIPSNMTMHVASPGVNIARGTTDPWVDTVTGGTSW